MTLEQESQCCVAGDCDASEAERPCRIEKRPTKGLTIGLHISPTLLLVGLLCSVDGFRLLAASNDPQLPVISVEEIGYSVTHWTVQEGLPGRIITSLAQTPDGYLWCGSTSGLARYDGAKFTVFYPEDVPALERLQVFELSCDRAGRLWIVGAKGELVVYEHGQFRRLGETDGIPPDQAGKCGEAREGDFWLKGRTDDRFYRYQGNRFEAVNITRIGSSSLDCFQTDATGIRWAVHDNNRKMALFTASGPAIQALIAPDGKSVVKAGRLFRLQDGSLGVTSSHGIYALKGSRWMLQRGFTIPVTDRGVLDAVEDWQGNFWVSMVGKGLLLNKPDGSTGLVSLSGLSRRVSVRTLLFGAEGNIWLACEDGLYGLRHHAFESQPRGLAATRNKTPNALLQDSKDTPWILYADGWARSTDTGWQYTAHRHPQAILLTGAVSRDGSMILGYNTGLGNGTAFVEKVFSTGRTEQLGSLIGNPRIIVESRDREIWVGTSAGLWRWESNRFIRVHLPEASGNYPVRALAQDREGRILTAAYRYGLYRLSGSNAWQRLTTVADAGSERILAIHLDEEDCLWAATDSGLARWRSGAWYSYARSRSALPRLPFSVTCDRYGGVWMASPFGVARVERRALNALAAGQDVALASDWFDGSDGLPSVSCVEEQSALCRLEDERIWVATMKGAAVLDPEEWQKRRARLDAPFVHIEAVLFEDKSLFDPGTRSGDTETAQIVVPPGAHRLEFRYTAVNLTANRKSRFRYRLTGVDEKWSDAGEERSAVYHGLRPGNYRFQVTAANKFGLWNNEGATVAFTVQPLWWQTLSARLGLGALVLGLVSGVYAMRLRQLRRRRAHQEEFARRLIESQEAERKRIAAELHDSLGQNLLIAKNQLSLARESVGDAWTQGKLKQVGENVDAALDEARTISRQLRPFQLERLGLTSAIRSMVRQTSESTKIPINAKIDPVDALLPADSEVMVYRILQEALSNVVKHADASEVHVKIGRNGHSLRMVVQDDGRGFDVERMLNGDNSERGLGLTGFEERTHLLRGHFHCRSSPGQGTTLTFEVPIPESRPNEAKN